MASQRQVLMQSNNGDEGIGVKPRLSRLESTLKRCTDALAAGIALILLSPVMLLIGLAIKLESRGPAVYRQTRVGKDGRAFTFYKFRSMYEGADRMRDGLEHLNEAIGPIFKIKNDPRITRVGRLIRKTSLDELPQFFNVIKGDMSLVGPRPPLPCEVAQYTAYHRQRLSVLPGMTCLWQISGRSDISFDRWVELDIEYIMRQSLGLDLMIILKTIPAVVKGTGAH